MSYRRRWWHVPARSRLALRKNAKRLGLILAKHAARCEDCKRHAENMARLVAFPGDALLCWEAYRLAFLHWHGWLPASTWERPDPNAGL